jgi:glycosyltransferase involved in cell wall biosynthesis
MRVLHLLKTSVGARWALAQLRELTHQGFECHVVVPDAGGLAPLYAAAGVTVHVLDLNASPLTPAFLPRARSLRRLVRRLSPDVVHSHFVATTLLMRFALRGLTCARVFQVPGPLHLENGAIARLELLPANTDDYWIASCEWTRRKYIALGVPADRVFLSHYGSDLDAYQPAATGALRAELGIGESTRLVGMVAYCYKPKAYLGSRRGIKGHEDFIDAVGLLRHGGRDVVGVVVGGPWTGAEKYYEAVQAYARQNTDARILFVGSRPDVARLYADLEVAVHPSLSENLGGAAESLLLGVPTVTTNVGGFPDLITEGVTGLMVPPSDPSRLAAAIGSVLDNRVGAAAMALEGQRHARALLDVRRTAAQVAAAYQSIAASRRLAGVTPAVGLPAHGLKPR